MADFYEIERATSRDPGLAKFLDHQLQRELDFRREVQRRADYGKRLRKREAARRQAERELRFKFTLALTGAELRYYLDPDPLTGATRFQTFG